MLPADTAGRTLALESRDRLVPIAEDDTVEQDRLECGAVETLEPPLAFVAVLLALDAEAAEATHSLKQIRRWARFSSSWSLSSSSPLPPPNYDGNEQLVMMDIFPAPRMKEPMKSGQ